jgi:hypothetical protein
VGSPIAIGHLVHQNPTRVEDMLPCTCTSQEKAFSMVFVLKECEIHRFYLEVPIYCIVDVIYQNPFIDHVNPTVLDCLPKISGASSTINIVTIWYSAFPIPQNPHKIK